MRNSIKTQQTIVLIKTEYIYNTMMNDNNELLVENESDVYATVNQLLSSFVLPMVLNCVNEMGVIELIHNVGSGHGLTPNEIAARIQTQNPDAPAMLDRMLRVLATHSVVACTTESSSENGGVERRYGLTALSKCLLPDEDGVSMASILSLAYDKVMLGTWSKVRESVLEGGVPFEKEHGMPIFEYSRLDSKFNGKFNKAMLDSSTISMKMILVNYKDYFKNIERLVDVGGGLGHSIGIITSKYPSIKGINFDLPHVNDHAPSYPGVAHVGGNMFESIPNGDAIFLKWILHNWSDEDCLILLKNCHKALLDNGKVIVVESIVTDEPETTNYAKSVSQLDILMMSIVLGGKERTRVEFESLAKAAGFSFVKVLSPRVASFWIMEFYK